MQLSKSRRNDIFQAVAAGRMDPIACQLDHDGNDIKVRHLRTSSWIRAAPSNTGKEFFCSWNIGTDPVASTNPRGVAWPGLLEKIRAWAEEVSDWAATPDLWSLRDTWQVFTNDARDETDNTPFTAAEQESVARQLAAIKESVLRTYQLTTEQESRIAARLDEAERASRRLGRKDWTMIFLGAVFALILTDAITPDIAQHMLMTAVHGLEHLFATGPKRIHGHAG